MREIRLRCPNAACRKNLSVREEHAGKKAKCPACGQVMVVPADKPAARAAPRIASVPQPSPTPPNLPAKAARLASPTPMPQTVSKPFYLGVWLAAGGVGILFDAMAMVVFTLWGSGSYSWSHHDPRSGILHGLGKVSHVLALGALLLLLYKMWDAVRAGPARTTPAKAVGFLFIPFFWLYWAFVTFWGWAKDYNAYVRIRGLTAPRMPVGLALASSVSLVCAFLVFPFTFSLRGREFFILIRVVDPVTLALVALFISKACDCLNAIGPAPGTGCHAPPEEGLPRGVQAPTSTTCSLAIMSFVFALAGFFVGIAAIAGIVLGILALSKIRKSEGRLAGKGLAIAGVACSAAYLLVAACCITYFGLLAK